MSTFGDWCSEILFTIHLRAIHECNQMVIDVTFDDIEWKTFAWDIAASDPLGDTPFDGRDGFIQIAQHENALNFEAMDRRFYINDYPEDIKPALLNNNQSWQSMNKGKISKRARRKL